jgi:large subunit ribosomal protein L6
MSRIGKQPIPLPPGVEVEASGQQLVVRGPKGVLERTLPEEVEVLVADVVVSVTRRDDSRRARAMHGLSRTLVANMVTGVSQGFQKQLEIVGVGYRAQARGPEELELALGFSHPVIVRAPSGIGFEVPVPTRVVV